MPLPLGGPSPGGRVLQPPYEEWLDRLRAKRQAEAGLAPSIYQRFPAAPPPTEIQAPLVTAPQGMSYLPEFDPSLQPEAMTMLPEFEDSPQAEAAARIREQEARGPVPPAQTGIKAAVPSAVKETLQQKIAQYKAGRGGVSGAEGPPVGVGTATKVGVDWGKVPEELRPAIEAGKPVYYPPNYVEVVSKSALDDATKAKLIKEHQAFTRSTGGLEADILRREMGGLQQRTEAQAGATEQSAYGDKMIADAIDQGILDMQDVQDQQQLFFNDWKQNTLKEQEAYRAALEKYEQGEIDPQRHWKKMGGWGRGMAAIAMALFGRHPGVQMTMQIIRDSVQNDINAQMEKKQRGKLGLEERRSFMNQLDFHLSTGEQAFAAKHSFVYKQLLTYVESLKARTASAVKTKRLEELMAGLRTELDTHEKKQELAARLAGKQAAYEAYLMRLRAIAGKKQEEIKNYIRVPWLGKAMPADMAKDWIEKGEGIREVRESLLVLKSLMSSPTAVIWGTPANQKAEQAKNRLVLGVRKLNRGAGALDKGLQEVGEAVAGADPTSVFQQIWGNTEAIDSMIEATNREEALSKTEAPGVAIVEGVTSEGKLERQLVPTGKGQFQETVETGVEAATGVTGAGVRKQEGKPVR